MEANNVYDQEFSVLYILKNLEHSIIQNLKKPMNGGFDGQNGQKMDKTDKR